MGGAFTEDEANKKRLRRENGVCNHSSVNLSIFGLRSEA